MKKPLTTMFVVLVAILMVAGGVLAQGAATSGSGGGTSEAPGATGGAGGSSGGASPSASPATPSASADKGDFTARHTMDGEVTKIDAKKGRVTLKTAEGNINLHFPPSALQNIKKGDHMSIELAMKPSAHASTDKDSSKGSASPGMSDQGDKKPGSSGSKY